MQAIPKTLQVHVGNMTGGLLILDRRHMAKFFGPNFWCLLCPGVSDAVCGVMQQCFCVLLICLLVGRKIGTAWSNPLLT